MAVSAAYANSADARHVHKSYAYAIVAYYSYQLQG